MFYSQSSQLFYIDAANLCRVASAGRATMAGPISLKTTSTSGALLSPRATSSLHKRLSLATFGEPVKNDWL